MNFDVRLPETDAVLAAVRARNPKRILNVGYGPGVITEKLADVCPTVATVASVHRVDQVRGHHPRNLQIIQAQPYALPFPEASFDTLLCTQLIDHLERPEERRAALAEMARVIKPDGRLIVTVRHQNFRIDRFQWAKEGISEGAFYHRYYLDEFREQLTTRWRIETICGVWIYLPKTYRIYTSLGRFVVYWERALRALPLSLRYGKVLLAVCSPA